MLPGRVILTKRPMSFQVTDKIKIVDNEQTSRREMFEMILLLWSKSSRHE